MQHATPETIEAADLDLNITSFVRSLHAENLSPRTVQSYQESASQLAGFLRSAGMPQQVAHLRREHVEAFITHLLDRWKPSTASVRFRGLQQFFRWLAEEGEIATSPMEHMKPPRVPEQPIPVLSDDQLRALLATCATGKSFEDRRDHAVLRTFVDTGARLAEIANLRFDAHDEAVNDVDLDQGILRVVGKSRRERVLPLGAKAIKALDRYLRERQRRPQAGEPWLWLGPGDRRAPETVPGRSDLTERDHYAYVEDRNVWCDSARTSQRRSSRATSETPGGGGREQPAICCGDHRGWRSASTACRTRGSPPAWSASVGGRRPTSRARPLRRGRVLRCARSRKTPSREHAVAK